MSSLSVVCIFKPRTICILIYLRDFRGKKKGFYLPAALTTDLYLSRWFTTKKKLDKSDRHSDDKGRDVMLFRWA